MRSQTMTAYSTAKKTKNSGNQPGGSDGMEDKKGKW